MRYANNERLVDATRRMVMVAWGVGMGIWLAGLSTLQLMS